MKPAKPVKRPAWSDIIPNTWLDPLLSGPTAVIGNPPYDGRDIERLLNAIRARAAKPAKNRRG